MNIYDFKMKDIAGQEVSFSDFRNKVLLIVNTATGCGFTPQYEGLEALYRKYRDQGLEILDFPCNQFKNQAPGTDAEIASICKLRYDVSFKQFSKIEVNGNNEAPLYTFLKSKKSGPLGKNIKWNFTKFLINRRGEVVKRFAPAETPASIEGKIVELLNDIV